MKILILSCNTGGGHNTAARAVREAAEAAGHEAVLEDYLALTNRLTSDVISNSYIGMARYSPHFFGMIYGASMKLSSAKRYSPLYYLNIPFARRLGTYLEQNPFDAIVATHLFAMEAVTYLRNKGQALPLSVGVATDYTCQPFWEDLDLDEIIIPHADLMSEYVGRGLDPKRLKPLGIPVSRRFSDEAASRDQARAELGLPGDKPVFLVMGGSMGSGHILTFTAHLRQAVPDGRVVVICGSNARLLDAMRERFGNDPGVMLIGFTDRVSDYMAACDVLYTKPGGLTSTEALVRNVPLIHTAPIPGCETANSKFFEEHGLSYAAPTIDQQIAYGCALASDAVRQRAMMANQASNARPDAAERIIDLIRADLEARAGGPA